MTAFLRDERGATAVEYGIMVALIAVVIVVAVTALGLVTADALCAPIDELESVGAPVDLVPCD